MPAPVLALAARLLMSGGARAAAGGAARAAPGTQLATRVGGNASNASQFTQYAAQATGQVAAEKGLGALGKAFHAVTHPLATVTSAIDQFHAAISQVEAPFKSIQAFFAHAGEYVKQLSPVKFELFERAVKDFEASVGKILVPVLELGTRMFKRFGDVVVTLTPIWSNWTTKLSEAFGKLADSGLELWTTWTKLVASTGLWDFFVNAIVAGMERLTEMAKALTLIVKNNPIAVTRRLLRGEPAIRTGSDITGSARGMAYTNTTVETPSALLTRTQQEAFKYGNGGTAGGTPEERSANYLQKIYELIKKFKLPTTEEAQNAVINRVTTIYEAAPVLPLDLLRRVIP